MPNFNEKTLCSNIISESETREHVKAVLTALNDSLSKSAGPYGSTGLVIEGGSDYFMTKDGFTILKNIRFNDLIMNIILKIITKSSQELVMTVGDGSTTSIMASYEIHKVITEMLEDVKDLRPKDIMDKLNGCVDSIVKELKRIAKPISSDMHELVQIAGVSVNNDFELGRKIGEIYKKGGSTAFINVKTGNGIETEFSSVEGFQIDYGYMDKILVNNNQEESRLKNASILMFNGTIDENCKPAIVAAINTVNESVNITGEQASIVIIAPDITFDMKAFFRQMITYQYANAIKNINIIKFPLATEHDINAFEDLSIMVGAKPILNTLGDIVDKKEVMNHVGRADEVVSTSKITTFTGVSGKEEEIEIRKGNIKMMLEAMEEAGIVDFVKRFELQKRLAVLQNNLHTITVGGPSDQAKTSLKFLIDDAVAACKSAIRHGYVLGCNLSISEAIREILTRDMEPVQFKMYKAIETAFFNVFSTIFKNKYKDDSAEATIKEIFDECMRTGTVYDLVKEEYNTDIINSVETEIEVLRNVVSIVSLIILSNQCITVNPETILEK